MGYKLLVGIFAGSLLGILMTYFFVPDGDLGQLFYTKITATSIVTGFCCSVYASFSKSKFQIFVISILIGILVFYVKYLITGHHFDPVIMGAFTGAIIGAILAIQRQIVHSIKFRKRLVALRKKGFSNYY